MFLPILHLLGALGLFLLGVTLMTDGLDRLVSRAVRSVIVRFTRSPTSGAVTGAVATAIVQSSSVTTVAAVGLVGAGAMTFPQALGIIFGANIGTTITGWGVALFGLRLDLGSLLPAFVFVGALARVFGRGRWATLGSAFAGFGLIFVGIDTMQSALAGFEGAVTPETFPPDTWGGRALLVLIGIVLTLVTQSSSAGVATALTAVHAGAISFSQAAAMVIGMDVGTTFTALLAALGGSTQARRTGFAHVFYNLLTGVMAFLILVPYTRLLPHLFPNVLEESPELALVGFHTFFNALGVVAVLPVTSPFSRMIERMIPGREDALTRGLEPSLLRDPDLALGAAVTTLQRIARRLFEVLAVRLRGGTAGEARTGEASRAVEETRRYLEPLSERDLEARAAERWSEALHVLDHLDRLSRRCRSLDRWTLDDRDRDLRQMGERVGAAFDRARRSDFVGEALRPEMTALWTDLEAWLPTYRARVLVETSRHLIALESSSHALRASRWLRRVTHHLCRIVLHLERLNAPRGTPAGAAPIERELEPSAD
ncbi:MAG: Na/Pi cotransporter family protein [Planctomycetes bacterium]|nr:Na/Pi cotransporter family protein [Planctomycetota bacterium]